MVIFDSYVKLPEGIVTLRKCYILYKVVPPPVISRFIIPLTIDISAKSPSLITQLSYLGGITLYPCANHGAGIFTYVHKYT